MAGLTGLEPATSGVTGRRSNQLSYNPLLHDSDGYITDNPTAAQVPILDIFRPASKRRENTEAPCRISDRGPNLRLVNLRLAYIMPPAPPMAAASSEGSMPSLGASETVASVIRIMAATEAAFCRAQRVTLAGSMTPISSMSPYSPV